MGITRLEPKAITVVNLRSHLVLRGLRSQATSRCRILALIDIFNNRNFSEVRMTLRFLASRQLASAVAAVSAAVTLNLWVNPSFAADPFRTSNPRPIGDRTEAAFKAIFQKGNYSEAQRYLEQAVTKEPNEPLAFAMKASLAYANQDWNALDTYAQKTSETAAKLIASDPLRGNLYAAVGQFLEGAAVLRREGTVRGTPQALSKLRQIYEYLDKAEAISKSDPELNLLKGYMDLMLAVNLPFSNPEQAIERLETSASPRYLADRGIALGYRDLKEYDQALNHVEKALKATSDNPELYYLKAQILREQGKKQKDATLLRTAVQNFDKAFAKKSQLPASVVKQLERERNNAKQDLEAVAR